jgi:hypothetical protein
MRQDRIQSKATGSFRQSPTGSGMARLFRFAAIGSAIVVAASLSPQRARAQEYPWCVSRESYLYCFYKTQQQCQWTASGIGGCALNPRLLFTIKPRDSYPNVASRSKDH